MPKRNLIWVLAIVLAALVTVWVSKNSPTVVSRDQGELRPVARAYRLIQDNYYTSIEVEALHEGAVSGIVGALDEFSSYIPPGQAVAFEHRVMGLQRGIGLQVEIDGDEVKVTGSLQGSPSHRAGLSGGDRILAIDDSEVGGATMEEVQHLLAGEVGTKVALVVLHVDGSRESITLVRSEFPIEAVTGLYRDTRGRWVHMIDSDKGIAYLRIVEFVRDTGEQFQRRLRQIGPVRGLVLDLRDNPGGLLTSAVEVADMFLSKGTIVISIGRNTKTERYVAHPDGTYPQVPLVVLIDSRTASAAEILAGALRVGDRAVLIGMRTRGKGCVQTMFHLNDGLGQLNLTTAEFYLSSGIPITRRPGADRWGVDPHEQVIIMPSSRRRLRRLRAMAQAVARPAKNTGSQDRALKKKLIELDWQLARAAALLGEPAEIELILTLAAAEREKRKAAHSARSGKGQDWIDQDKD